MASPTTHQGRPGSPDPATWLDLYGNYLYAYAMARVRNPAVAEDLVQDTLLAALQAYDSFSGRSSERTWLVGILKHKIIDSFRRASRETPASQLEGEELDHDEFFRDSGEFAGHWKANVAPAEWTDTPAGALERTEFWQTFDLCLSPLPSRIASAFTLREIDGLTTEEICEILSITSANLWVMLHRARIHLRHCLEVNWFRPKREA